MRLTRSWMLSGSMSSQRPERASGARRRAAPARDSLRRSRARPAAACSIASRKRRRAGTPARCGLGGKLAVERIVLDRDRRRARRRAGARGCSVEAAHVVGGRDWPAPACRPRRRIPDDGRSRDRRRSSWRGCRHAPERNARLSVALVSNAGSSGSPDSRADRPVDRAAEPFEIVQRVADEIAERAAAVVAAGLPVLQPHPGRRVLDVPVHGDVAQPRRSRPRRAAPWPSARP